MDEKMKFNCHVKEISSKISKSIGIIYNLSQYIPVTALIPLYFSLILPYFNYCTTIWGAIYDIHLKPLELLQKRCVRIITKSTFLAHTDPLFQRCKILKIRDLFKYRVALRAYKDQNIVAAQYNSNHSYSTRSSSLLRPDYQRLTVTQQSIHYLIPTVWNSIPVSIKNSKSLNIFKREYRSYLLSLYNTC